MRFTKKNTLVEQEKEKYINAAPLEEKKKVRNISVILNSIETTGTVIRYEEHKNSENGFTYSTKYSYIDKNNKEHIKTGTSASYPPEYEIGTKIKVFYNSKDFDKSIYESKTVKIICLIFGIGGFIIFSIGFIIFICAGMEK